MRESCGAAGVGSGPGAGTVSPVQGGGPSAGVMRSVWVVDKVGTALKSCRASRFWAECGNRARAQGSGPSARIVLARFGSECRNSAKAHGSDPSARIVLS